MKKSYFLKLSRSQNSAGTLDSVMASDRSSTMHFSILENRLSNSMLTDPWDPPISTIDLGHQPLSNPDYQARKKDQRAAPTELLLLQLRI